MQLNGTSKTVMAIILSVVVTIFIMLFSGLTGSVESIQTTSRDNRERIVAVEVRIESIVEKINEIHLDQKEIKEDIKEILKALR